MNTALEKRELGLDEAIETIRSHMVRQGYQQAVFTSEGVMFLVEPLLMVDNSDDEIPQPDRPDRMGWQCKGTLDNPITKLIYETICGSPGPTAKQLRKGLSLDSSEVSYHTMKLQSAGLITRSGRFRYSQYYPTTPHDTDNSTKTDRAN